MSKKLKVNGIESGSRELSEENVESQPVISFDMYFRKMLVTREGTHQHHKLPMKQYAEANGLVEATEEQFEQIFRSY